MPEIIWALISGGKVVIGTDGRLLVELICSSGGAQDRKAGSAAHLPHWMADDFDAPLEEFREYME